MDKILLVSLNGKPGAAEKYVKACYDREGKSGEDYKLAVVRTPEEALGVLPDANCAIVGGGTEQEVHRVVMSLKKHAVLTVFSAIPLPTECSDRRLVEACLDLSDLEQDKDFRKWIKGYRILDERRGQEPQP